MQVSNEVLLPSSIMVVSSVIFSPDIEYNFLSMFKVSFSDCSVPSRKICVLSAYWLNQNSCPFMLIPVIISFSLIIFPKISVHSINIYGEIGSPCLHPLLRLKNQT